MRLGCVLGGGMRGLGSLKEGVEGGGYGAANVNGAAEAGALARLLAAAAPLLAPSPGGGGALTLSHPAIAAAVAAIHGGMGGGGGGGGYGGGGFEDSFGRSGEWGPGGTAFTNGASLNAVASGGAPAAPISGTPAPVRKSMSRIGAGGRVPVITLGAVGLYKLSSVGP
jgi:hypothetical protein